jgi:ribosomal protein S18 acetylase RimI-like enzyme
VALDGLVIRQATFPQDAEGLAGLDTSFETDLVYSLVRGELSMLLEAREVDPPFRKRYDIGPSGAGAASCDFAAVCELRGRVVGFVAAEFQEWNRRVAIWHLYVAQDVRGMGIGSALLNAVEEHAVQSGARGLWVETQNTNYKAVSFYLSRGFQFCGFDECLYDPADQDRPEVALFFSKPAPKETK